MDSSLTTATDTHQLQKEKLLITTLSQQPLTMSWTYKNPSEWSKSFPCANGLYQSPINIKTHETVSAFFSSLTFSSKYDSDLLLTLTNTGQQIISKVATDSNENEIDDLWISGMNLDGKYHFFNFHIHWGHDDTQGSEHELDGHRFPAEAHFVHKNNQTKRLAVIGFFFTITDNDSEDSEWDRFAKIVSQLTKQSDKTTAVFNLSRLMQMKYKEFYRYDGSLTTPPCTEGVIWSLFPYEVPIKEESLKLLRENIMPNTYRPVQPLNGRIVYRNFNQSRTI